VYKNSSSREYIKDPFGIVKYFYVFLFAKGGTHLLSDWDYDFEECEYEI